MKDTPQCRGVKLLLDSPKVDVGVGSKSSSVEGALWVEEPVQMKKIKELFQDFLYAVKLIRGVISGFDGLQCKMGGKWTYICLTIVVQYTEAGRREASPPLYEVRDHPYYVCALWKDGTHTSLPIILGDGENIGDIQKSTRTMLEKAWWKNFEDAFMACAYYQNQYDA